MLSRLCEVLTKWRWEFPRGVWHVIVHQVYLEDIPSDMFVGTTNVKTLGCISLSVGD